MGLTENRLFLFERKWIVNAWYWDFCWNNTRIASFPEVFCKFLVIYNLHSEIQIWSLWPFCGSVRALSRETPATVGRPREPQKKVGWPSSWPRCVVDSWFWIPWVVGYQVGSRELAKSWSRWWFQILFISNPIWGTFPFWLIFFKGVETTN